MKDNVMPPAGPSPGVTPLLVVRDAAVAADFYRQAFHAEEIARFAAADGRILHLRLRMFGSFFVLMDEYAEWSGPSGGFRAADTRGATTVALHLQVAGADQVWQQAIAAGAVSVVPIQQQFWGELYGRLQDPFGHEWTIAQRLHHLNDHEVAAAAGAAMEAMSSN